MLTEITRKLKISILLLLILSLLTGIIYPGCITLIAQIIFPWTANGSLIKNNGKWVGSSLIGQTFSNSKYFWGRPSATPIFPYNPLQSGGSNMAISNPDYIKILKERADYLRANHADTQAPIPVELLTASGSGLDPHISPAAAYYQVPRIAKARNIPESQILTLVNNNIISRTFKIFGEPHVNVLELNLALDAKNYA